MPSRATFDFNRYNPNLVCAFCVFVGRIDQVNALISLGTSCARYTHIIAERTPWQVREIRKNRPSVE
jgi:hypothetical protein